MSSASAQVHGQTSDRFVSPPCAVERNGQAGRVLVIVLAGGRGSRLGPLTDHRAKPAVAFGNGRRIIDFTLANCLRSGLRRVAVLGQYQRHSLQRHVQTRWALPPEQGDFVDMMHAGQGDGSGEYLGTADAVFQHIDFISQQQPEVVLVLGGDHVYNMDYRRMLADHATSQADVSVACVEVPLAQAHEFGIIETDGQRRVVGWQEKPRAPKAMAGSPQSAMASMGLYACNTAALVAALRADHGHSDSGHDFGHDLVPLMLRTGRQLHAHSFSDSCIRAAGAKPYWRDVGTLDAYWAANIDLLHDGRGCDPSACEGPPSGAGDDSGKPTRFGADAREFTSRLLRSLIGGGCVIGAADIRDSVISSDVRVGHGAQIDESVLLPGAEIGVGVRLRRVIVDQHCRLPAGLMVGFDAQLDRHRFHVTDGGVTLITADMFDKAATVAPLPAAPHAPALAS